MKRNIKICLLLATSVAIGWVASEPFVRLRSAGEKQAADSRLQSVEAVDALAHDAGCRAN